MKKLTIIIFLFIGFYSRSQVINLEPDTVSTLAGSEWKFVKVYNNFVVESVPVAQDYVKFSINKIPDALFEGGIVKIYHEQIGDTLLKYTDEIMIDITYGRRLVLYQQVLKYVNVEVEKSTEEKMFFYLKRGKEMDITNSQFYNYPPIKDIVNQNDSI